jgi:hypothetical protein
VLLTWTYEGHLRQAVTVYHRVLGEHRHVWGTSAARLAARFEETARGSALTWTKCAPPPTCRRKAGDDYYWPWPPLRVLPYSYGTPWVPTCDPRQTHDTK